MPFFHSCRTVAVWSWCPADSVNCPPSAANSDLSSMIPRSRVPPLTRSCFSYLAALEEGEPKREGWPSAYSVSKVALNALTRILARDLASRRIRVNSVCPGWVRTDMGGRGATRSVEVGARSIVLGAMLPDDATGGFYRDGKRIHNRTGKQFPGRTPLCGRPVLR